MARKKTETPAMPTASTEAKLRPVRLELTEDAHRMLRLEAAKRDVSLAELARDLVTEGLEKLFAKGKGKGDL